MKITCISDTHQHHTKIKMPTMSDMIIHAGDFTYHGKIKEVINFLDWYKEQDSKYKLLICGNHEVEISKYPELLKEWCNNRGIELLRNEHTVIEGFTIFGSPYSNEFGHGWAYMQNEAGLTEIYNIILPETDILITHGPAYGQLDLCPNGNVGSESLANKLEQLTNCKLHVTGHIHESRGVLVNNNRTTVNAAICGIPYTDVLINPITVEIFK